MKKSLMIPAIVLALIGGVGFGSYKAIDAITGPKQEMTPAAVPGSSPISISVAAIGKENVEQMIGERILSPERVQEAADEWMSAPIPFFEPAGMPEIVEREFDGLAPSNLAELLAAFAAMYRGEEPFDSTRAQAIEYLSTQEPIVSEIKKLGMPFPVLRIDADHPDKAFAVSQSFKEFNAFVDRFLGKPTKKEPRISLTAEQYEVMSDIVRKVEAGELADDQLRLAGPLIKRMLQDIDDPFPNSSIAKMKPEDREQLRQKWTDLLDRYEENLVAP